MKCGFCGLEFQKTQAVQACSACPLTPGCHLIRCPRCGYEMPPESKLITWLRGLRRGRLQASTESVPCAK